jgi:hypothetical protein
MKNYRLVTEKEEKIRKLKIHDLAYIHDNPYVRGLISECHDATSYSEDNSGFYWNFTNSRLLRSVLYDVITIIFMLTMMFIKNFILILVMKTYLQLRLL